MDLFVSTVFIFSFAVDLETATEYRDMRGFSVGGGEAHL